MICSQKLVIIMYHYVRNFPETSFPRLKGILTTKFQEQVTLLSKQYEMASLESALVFLQGEYTPKKNLCLLTFDDGLIDHYTDVFPILTEKTISGVFFLTTSSIEHKRVIFVHKNHFLLAHLGFDNYKQCFLEKLTKILPNIQLETRASNLRQVYRWDPLPIASFKYLINYQLPLKLRDEILDILFKKYIGDETGFAGQLYMQWSMAREMQTEGMIIGGHTHHHDVLSELDTQQQQNDLATCRQLLDERLHGQSLWPFSYPYGKALSYNTTSVKIIKALKFNCAFASEVGHNEVGQDIYAIRRVDPKDV